MLDCWASRPVPLLRDTLSARDPEDGAQCPVILVFDSSSHPGHLFEVDTPPGGVNPDLEPVSICLSPLSSSPSSSVPNAKGSSNTASQSKASSATPITSASRSTTIFPITLIDEARPATQALIK